MIDPQNIDAESDEDAVEELYHYTTTGGLLGILDSSQLWATHPAYLNDSQELEYGLNSLRHFTEKYIRKLEREAKEATPEERKAKHSRKAVVIGAQAIMFNDSKFNQFVKHDAAPFISCLSRARDQLSQWRGYSKGGGYAIKFDPQLLESSLRQVGRDGRKIVDSTPFLVPVSYEIDRLKELMQEALDKYCDDMAKLIPGGFPVNKDDIPLEFLREPINYLMVTIMLLISRVKNSKFSEEREYRIYDSVEETFYTPSSIGLIPRTAFHFDTHAIKEIMVGPGEFSDVKKLSIERYLTRNRDRYPNVDVTLSEVPYRDI